MPPSDASASTAESPPSTEAPLRAAKFTAIGAERIAATCIGAEGTGTESTLVRQLYAGPCTVRVDIDGMGLTTVVEVREARGLSCAVEEGELTCR